jgi:phosphatidylglycerol:prolipoprotein diacylglycerol transferase
VLPTFSIAGLEIVSFQAAMLAAFIAGTLVARAQAIWLRQSPAIVWDILPWAAVAGIIGAQLYGALLTGRLAGSGMVWYGGLITGVAAAVWRYRRWHLPAGWFVLGGAPAVALGHAIGRIGCFLAGDDWGRPTDSFVGVAFPQGAPPTTAGELRARGVEVATSLGDDAVLRVHPVQIYESVFLFILFYVLLRMTRRGASAPVVAATYLGAYGTWRFAIEFARVKSDFVLPGLTSAQLISLAFMGAAVALSLAHTRRSINEVSRSI